MTSSNPKEMLFACHNLWLELNGEQIFAGITLTINAGKIVAIVDNNGSGKTLLLEVIAGKRKASGGRLLWAEGLRPRGDLRYISQCPRFFFWRKVHQQLWRFCVRHLPEMCAELKSAPPISAFLNQAMTNLPLTAMVNFFGMSRYLSSRIYRLSTGLKKRLALVELLVAPAPIWLLDDPFALLDEHGREQLKWLMEAHLRNGGGILITAHSRGLLEGGLPKDACVEWTDMRIYPEEAR